MVVYGYLAGNCDGFDARLHLVYLSITPFLNIMKLVCHMRLAEHPMKKFESSELDCINLLPPKNLAVPGNI